MLHVLHVLHVLYSPRVLGLPFSTVVASSSTASDVPSGHNLVVGNIFLLCNCLSTPLCILASKPLLAVVRDVRSRTQDQQQVEPLGAFAPPTFEFALRARPRASASSRT